MALPAALVPALWGAFIMIAGSVVKRVLIGLGFGVITFIGTKLAMNSFIDMALAKLSGLPADMMNMLSLCGFGTCISIISSAIMMRMVLAGLSMVNDRAANLRFIGNKSGFWG
ncbi:hypothetical protein CUZ56_00476 [Saezia sanguinis]|uniref:DUF2523 domain-containing protein n=1 Tax=Saezia sanguinis TaxID=1965230 RepID=A0A433SGW9_9BURK|nr:DUF2523 domain-containing protein [Saezia sanguinis]RUS67980.1 hypothetical protein CUZ56_00463 [Saezia sanguinis]RUS67993.1 hypothetical protein CUZ56_00476 [Saezia sanguinis]